MIVGGSTTVMMIFLHRLVAVPETIRPNRNWTAKKEKQTKQRDEEALHTVLFRYVLSLTDDETRFKSFEKLGVTHFEIKTAFRVG